MTEEIEIFNKFIDEFYSDIAEDFTEEELLALKQKTLANLIQ